MLRYNYKDFSVGSWKAMVDIDAAELFKPTITVDLKIACDCRVRLAAAAQRSAAGRVWWGGRRIEASVDSPADGATGQMDGREGWIRSIGLHPPT